ncbi:MAG: ThuA domain-containing protein [Verrucomicrobia bacterium]|nr:ThuA domain-containing protein [Verrucomicrobiota bacterium]
MQPFTRRLVALTLLALASFSLACSHAAEAITPRAMRVCLVSGANDSAPYGTDASLAALARYLETEHKMTCTLLAWDAATAGFKDIDRLLEADAAVFFVRRKTPDAHNLDVLRRFFASGKGFIALRSTSHAWENWPDFDAEVLGAKYGGAKGGNFGIADRLIRKPHPIWAGTEDFDTKCDLYRSGPLAPDVQVLMEGETKNGVMPVAWTRVHGGGRLFHLALGYAYDMEKPSFRRIVANALHWVSTPVR